MTKWSRWISAKRTQLRHFVTICLHVKGWLRDSRQCAIYLTYPTVKITYTIAKEITKQPLSDYVNVHGHYQDCHTLFLSDRYHLNEYFLRLSSPGWIFRVSLLHAPGKREREALGTSLSLFLQPERNGDASNQKRICPIIFSSRDTNYRDVLYLLENIISPLQR